MITASSSRETFRGDHAEQSQRIALLSEPTLILNTRKSTGSHLMR